MSDLIRREDAVKMLREKAQGYTVSMFATISECYMAKGAATECAAEVNNLPAVDAEPVRHGRWTHTKTYYKMDECHCSECDQLMTTYVEQRMKYCPNCGAKMDGGESDDI